MINIDLKYKKLDGSINIIHLNDYLRNMNVQYIRILFAI